MSRAANARRQRRTKRRNGGHRDTGDNHHKSFQIVSSERTRFTRSVYKPLFRQNPFENLGKDVALFLKRTLCTRQSIAQSLVDYKTYMCV